MKKSLTIFVVFVSAFFVSQLFASSFDFDNDDGYKLIVKFSADYVFDAEDGELFLSPVKTISQKEVDIIERYQYEQVMDFSEEEKKRMRTGTYLAPRGRSSFNIYNYRGLVYVKGAETKTLEELSAIVKDLEQLHFVEYTDLVPLRPPADPSINHLVRSDTPDLTAHQDYRQYIVEGDIIGINIEYAWNIGVYGQGIKIADIESGFDYEHEDLQSDDFVELVPHFQGTAIDHGTAVAGIMIAIDNDYGMTGMVHQADKFFGISRFPNSNTIEIPSGIAAGLEELEAGDVFVFEIQSFGPFDPDDERYIPADWSETVWDLTQDATDAGIIVVAVAGNGAVDLDDEPLLEDYMNRGDNGAIIVGAGTRDGRNRAFFSTYGSRVNLQGWGDWTVATTGYGDLFDGGTHRTYTGEFAGTSSATPIVASAVVAVQSFAKNELGFVLTPLEMRNLLVETGTPQGTGWGDAKNIVPQPNVGAAIEQLIQEYGDPVALPVRNWALFLGMGFMMLFALYGVRRIY